MTESLTASVRNTRLAVNTPDFTFSGVTVGTDKKLDITWQYPGSNASWNPFVNAIVIEVIPEPSTYAFAGVGALLALGAVVLRRRK
jgi:LPXTG-motif cell wall-anchored protein